MFRMSSDNHSSSEHQADRNRRKIVKASLAVPPILATLSSKPVQAVQGLSNMLSGNASVCRGDDRYGGMSPGFWKTPVGTTQLGHSNSIAWSATGYSYGDLISGKNGKKWDHYTGGTPFNSVFGGGDSRSLREFLNEEPGSDYFHLIAGLLNARYFESVSPAGRTQYIFTTQQFWDMYNGNLEIPDAYASLRDLIESNYSPFYRTPGDECP